MGFSFSIHGDAMGGDALSILQVHEIISPWAPYVPEVLKPFMFKVYALLIKMPK